MPTYIHFSLVLLQHPDFIVQRLHWLLQQEQRVEDVVPVEVQPLVDPPEWGELVLQQFRVEALQCLHEVNAAFDTI